MSANTARRSACATNKNLSARMRLPHHNLCSELLRQEATEATSNFSKTPICRRPLLLPIPRKIRHYVFQFRVAHFGLARNRHAVQAVPHYGFDQSWRKIGPLLEHRRNLPFVFHCQGGSAG